MVNSKSLFQPVNIYFAFWCLYRLQGPLYPSGGIISKLLLLIILLWSICIMFRVNTRVRSLPRFIYAVNLFLLVSTLYGALLIISGQELYITEGIYRRASNFDYLKYIYMSLLPIYVFFYYSLKRSLTLRHIMFYSICLLLICVANYIHGRNEALLMAMEMGHTTEGVTLNVGYSFLAVMPLLIYWNQKRAVQFCLLILTMLFIIICVKRGAILIGTICSVYFLCNAIKNARPHKRIVVLLLSLFTILAAAWFVIDMLNSNEYFAYRIEETLAGDSSNRDILYSTYWNHFLSETNFLRFIFGNGANATLKIGMNYAHNDWLELLINNGILGIFIYVIYFISLYKDSIIAKRTDSNHYAVILLAFIILFCSSMFSMSYASINIALTIAIGFSLGSVQIMRSPNQ